MPHPVFGRYQDFDGLAQQVLSAITKELFRLRVDELNHAAVVDDDHCIGRGFQQAAKFGFRFFAVGNVANRADSQDALIRLERAQAYLDREFGSIPPESIQLESGSHCSGSMTHEISVAMALMRFLEPAR